VACTNDMAASLRREAVRAAVDIAPDAVATALRELLARLVLDGEPDHHPDRDDLVGTLLSWLWPEHLQLADVLAHVRPGHLRGSAHMYRWQILTFPQGVTEDAIAELIAFILEATAPPPAAHATTITEDASLPDTGAPFVDDDLEDGEHVGRVPIDLVDCVINRVTRSPNFPDYLPKLAVVIMRRLLTHGQATPIPSALDLIDLAG
jgi:hypothetical protein